MIDIGILILAKIFIKIHVVMIVLNLAGKGKPQIRLYLPPKTSIITVI